ncbi:MAG: hypothetical protein Fur0046_06050 [Cyanobacteria bacterium J069]
MTDINWATLEDGPAISDFEDLLRHQEILEIDARGAGCKRGQAHPQKEAANRLQAIWGQVS